jgi:hypothetical protein
LRVTNFAQSISTEPKTFSVASLTLAFTTVQGSGTTAKDFALAAPNASPITDQSPQHDLLWVTASIMG